MGTYHLINNVKVRVVYPGNTRTCGRCHQAPTSCLGGGIARVCGEKGGDRVSLSSHMRWLWAQVGFSPGINIAEDEELEEEAIERSEDTPDLEPINDASFNDTNAKEAKGHEVVSNSEGRSY